MQSRGWRRAGSKIPRHGRLAQRESAAFTRQRCRVQHPERPPANQVMKPGEFPLSGWVQPRWSRNVSFIRSATCRSSPSNRCPYTSSTVRTEGDPTVERSRTGWVFCSIRPATCECLRSWNRRGVPTVASTAGFQNSRRKFPARIGPPFKAVNTNRSEAGNICRCCSRMWVRNAGRATEITEPDQLDLHQTIFNIR